ncbi:hypothetical protein [Nodularia sp. NIES-3585]|uniref:hypothetical protein n=1 Tax=Nodularia sp. NIES-3585 TaxID=1973477 RepID=UPI000B5C98DC|nr:hypothetical protein [Nodularia sp. NIES-3585]GAX38318.1 hypothetical protein NIES3585_43670 [Nodularia sp. NIES-3585]
MRKDNEQIVIVKGAIPKTLKLQFKVICVKQELNMSEVLEQLIRQWIQLNAPIHKLPVDLANEEYEDVKGYIPKALKIQFKYTCTQKCVMIRSILYLLVKQWVEMQTSSANEAR